jgi:hypothetical protein
MSLLLLFNGGGARSASASITEADDLLAAISAVLASASVSLAESDDAVSATITVLVSATASISEAADSLAASASNAAEVVSNIGGGAGGYVRRVRTKPKPIAKPKPLDRRIVQLAVREHDDAVSAAATVDGQSIAEAAALALAEAEAARKRVIDHNNNFLMAA